MFPRLPRLRRLVLFVVGLTLTLLFLLRAGGDHHGRSGPADPFHPRRFPPSAVPGQILTGPRHSHTPPRKQRAQEVLRSNGTTGARPSAESKATSTPLNVVNPHPFSYLINPRDACLTSRGHVKMLVYVHSAPANFKKRMSIRQTWADRGVLQAYNATIVFIMGMVPDASIMDLMQMESETYGDIVQEDFLDTYRNLTYKAIAGLKWAASFCPRVAYILKTDDDILVNLPRVVQHIRAVVGPQYGSERLILCNQWVRMKIIRDTKSKWYVSEKELKGDFFAPYCSGSAFLLSGDMAKLMYEASLVTPFFWVDDFYITGSLIHHLNIKHKVLNKAYILNPGVAEGKFHNDTRHELFFFHLHKLRLMYYMWKNMTAEAGLTTARTLNVKRFNSVPAVARAA